MAKYRKKPVVVDAIQWRPEEMLLHDIMKFCGGLKGANAAKMGRKAGDLIIETKEGEMIASPGDWIIKEPFPSGDRQFYPCKPDIFEQTYEVV